MSQHANSQNPKDDSRQTVGEWLSRPFEWRIPVYQRHYAWDANNDAGPVYLFWETVKEQVAARLRGETPNQHYLGAVLVDNKTRRDATSGITVYDVVDGQQRLTTIQLALLALIRVAGDNDCGEKIQSDLEEFLFVNKPNTPRLAPTNFDNKQYQTVLFDTFGVVMDFGSQTVSKENAEKSKIVATSKFFQEGCAGLVRDHNEHAAAEVCDAVAQSLLYGFDLVLIVLRESDEAQKIFESLNNYAKPLTTFDLIRNYVFYRAASLDEGRDVRLFGSTAWRQLEKPYWEGKADNRKVGWATHIEAYIARMLVAKLREVIKFDRNSIFKAYKTFGGRYDGAPEEEVRSLAEHVDVYRYLDAATEVNPVDANCDFGVFRYNVWGNRDFYPVLFRIAGCERDVDEKRRMVRLLESYVIRRGVCKLPSDNYNLFVAKLCEQLGDEPSYDGLYTLLAAAESRSTWFPIDSFVAKKCLEAKFYGSPFQRYVLDEVEKSMHDPKAERVVVEQGSLTVDHILPQGWESNEAWMQVALGDSVGADAAGAELVVKSYLHTIGNLTLLSGKNNTVKSNRPFEEVKAMLCESTLKLNRAVAAKDAWGVEEIRARSAELAGRICEIWPYDVE